MRLEYTACHATICQSKIRTFVLLLSLPDYNIISFIIIPKVFNVCHTNKCTFLHLPIHAATARVSLVPQSYTGSRGVVLRVLKLLLRKLRAVNNEPVCSVNMEKCLGIITHTLDYLEYKIINARGFWLNNCCCNEVFQRSCSLMTLGSLYRLRTQQTENSRPFAC